MLNKRFAAAALLNWGVAVAMAGVGVHYLASDTLMPYHLQVLDVPWNTLTPHTQMLFLTLMKGTGLVGLLAGVSLAVLLAVPFRRREPWARYAVLLVGAMALVPTLIGAVRLRMATGVSAEWWPHVAMLVCLAVSFRLAGRGRCHPQAEGSGDGQ
jgi:hypothetical protein